MMEEKSASLQKRAFAIALLMSVAMVGLIVRLFYIQVLDHEKYEKQAFQQHWTQKPMPAHRGSIFDRNGIPLALSIPSYSCYADPKMIKNPPETAKLLSPLLEIPETRVLSRLTRPDTHFVWLQRFLDKTKRDQIVSLKLAGVDFFPEPRRAYPYNQLAAHLLGFVGTDGTGLEGVEASFNPELTGEPGFRWELKDGRLAKWKIYSPEGALKPPKHGADVYLTIDSSLQAIVEKELEDAVVAYEAVGACAVLLSVKTAEVLAIASRPTYDPNHYQKFPRSTWRNKAIVDAYELGSVMKPLVVSAALAENLVTPQTVIFCDHGACRIIPGRVLHDTHGYGDLTVTEVLVKSSNIGTTKIGMKLGAKRLCNYLEFLGFGKKSGIEIPGEGLGILKPASKWTDFTLTSVPMGHEICATPLQMAAAYLTLASDGIYRPPTIIQKIVHRDKTVLHRYQREKLMRIYPPHVIEEMRSILRCVVERGTAKKANIPGVAIAGKTGTAQKIDANGQYSHEKYISVFVGFAPYDDPQLCAMVMVDEPKGAYYGGTVSAPPVANILKNCLFHEEEKKKKN